MDSDISTGFTTDQSFDAFEDDGYDDLDTNSVVSVVAEEPLSYEVPYTSLSHEQLKQRFVSSVNQIQNLCGLSHEVAELLLIHNKFNIEWLGERYLDNPARTLQSIGLDLKYADYSFAPRLLPAPPNFLCAICCDDATYPVTFALPCGHRYCASCFKTYLRMRVSEGDIRLNCCLNSECRFPITDSVYKLLLSPSDYNRYRDQLIKLYVNCLPYLKWCIYPDCTYAVECKVNQADLDHIIPTVECNDGHKFCFGCSNEEHAPCICRLFAKWNKKCADDSETANWINVHTKGCPKCQATIEKNGGCNHMLCRKCGHEWCWVCSGPWSEHGTAYYNCSRYDEKSGQEARDQQAKSKASLERYLHYYNRYANHLESARLDKKLYLRTQKKMTDLQNSTSMTWIEVQYLANASDVLQHCRRTLMWTYAFAFYLERNNNTHIFENNQQDLELAVEKLSEMFERNTSELATKRLELLDMTSYVSTRRSLLLKDTQLGLLEGRWKYNLSN
ncbi:hypothetical protein CANCADRAFT_113366 [Tortispora caseinolytica NRRL Y-17796]|uniref:RBR-type E3 ubiquitin transferase n=1 Tax=Tortispora caseinolytica NRRL Y-17796 TaxID=767744 RepID=A0A1E4TGM4_9ASCO|nr:hypothetical protein CANCADRAFT_113366 [Tortispora caseinolytica NRRL Y-17796]